MAGSLALRVLTPAKVVYESLVRSLVAPAWDGRVGVFPDHAPFITVLGQGVLAITDEAGEVSEFTLTGGVMKVEANQVMVLADDIG